MRAPGGIKAERKSTDRVSQHEPRLLGIIVRVAYWDGPTTVIFDAPELLTLGEFRAILLL